LKIGEKVNSTELAEYHENEVFQLTDHCLVFVAVVVEQAFVVVSLFGLV
jgi:hypothetical protein